MSASPEDPGISLEELRGLSDREVVQRHDALSDFLVSHNAIRAAYVAELNRRASDRQARASNRLSIIAVVVSVLTLITGVVLPLITR